MTNFSAKWFHMDVSSRITEDNDVPFEAGIDPIHMLDLVGL